MPPVNPDPVHRCIRCPAALFAVDCGTRLERL